MSFINRHGAPGASALLLVLIVSLVLQADASLPLSATTPALELSLAHTQLLLLNKAQRGVACLRGGTSPTVTVVDSPETVRLCRVALYDQAFLALDCEGVSLGRSGEISLIQLATETECFLLDVQDKPRTDPVVELAKEVLEDASICKIIHDCRSDSDALSTLLGIKLNNVHDTQAWYTSGCHLTKASAGLLLNIEKIKLARHSRAPSQQTAGTAIARLKLNELLALYELPSNAVRDNSVYQTYPRFWASRPLTEAMIEWASGDVRSLFQLREAQELGATVDSAEVGGEASDASLEAFRDAFAEEVNVPKDDAGRFIGTCGRNIRAIETEFQVTFNKCGETNHVVSFLMFAQDVRTLARAVTHVKKVLAGFLRNSWRQKYDSSESEIVLASSNDSN